MEAVCPRIWLYHDSQRPDDGKVLVLPFPDKYGTNLSTPKGDGLTGPGGARTKDIDVECIRLPVSVSTVPPRASFSSHPKKSRYVFEDRSVFEMLSRLMNSM